MAFDKGKELGQKDLKAWGLVVLPLQNLIHYKKNACFIDLHDNFKGIASYLKNQLRKWKNRFPFKMFYFL